jgi:hypothetical protein
MQVSFQTAGLYLVPCGRNQLPKKLQYDGVVGVVGVAVKPYYWTVDYSTGTITGPDGTWDLYDDDNESVVFLWKRLNNNHLQQFQLPQFPQGNIVSQNERPVCVDIMESTLVSLKVTGSSSSSSIYTVKSKITLFLMFAFEKSGLL